eukprot:13227839-Alexandrium_andersonii.AAC.1
MAAGICSLPPTGPSIKKLLASRCCKAPLRGGYRPRGPPDWRLRRNRPHGGATAPLDPPPKSASGAPETLFG